MISLSAKQSTDYLFLSAYLRAKEKNLLGRERLARLAAAPNAAEAAKVLEECGYPDLADATDADLEAALSARREAVFSDVEKLLPEKAMAEIFRLRYDYHNAKVLVKAEAAGAERAELLSASGRVSPETLTEAFRQDDGRALPPALAAAMRQARSTLARAANPQLADMELDKAWYAESFSLAAGLSSDFCTRYLRLSADVANLRSAVRCLRGGMDEGVLRAALIPGGNVSAERIARAAYGEGVSAAFTDRRLAEAAALGEKAAAGAPLGDFERACDNALTRFLDEAKLVGFGPEPAAAYLASVEGEIIAARMALQGKRAGVSNETLRERLRESYV